MMLAAFPARLAYGMVALDIYFKVHDDTHSIALAGLAAGANGLVGSITTGARAAVIDRMGLKVPLRFFVPAYAIALASFDACHGATLLILFAGISLGPAHVAYRGPRGSISDRNCHRYGFHESRGGPRASPSYHSRAIWPSR
jgi:hypothetical protein